MPPFTAGSNISGVRSKYFTAMACNVPVSGGTTEAITMPEMLLEAHVMVIAQIGHEDTELVGRALADRREAPAVHQLRALEHANHDVGVADVNGKQHGVYCYPIVIC